MITHKPILIEIECPECEGQGYVWYIDFLGFDGSQRDHEEYCPQCNGEGKIWIEQPEDEE